MLKVSVSQQYLSTSALWLLLLVLLPHALLQCPYKLPAKPSNSAFCQVHTGTCRLCFNGLSFLLSVLKALFYLTVGNLLLTKVVRIQNVKVPRVSVNI